MTCVGHIIGAVIADTPEHAQRAALGVKITYDDLPAIITMEVIEYELPVEKLGLQEASLLGFPM